PSRKPSTNVAGTFAHAGHGPAVVVAEEPNDDKPAPGSLSSPCQNEYVRGARRSAARRRARDRSVLRIRAARRDGAVLRERARPRVARPRTMEPRVPARAGRRVAVRPRAI